MKLTCRVYGCDANRHASKACKQEGGKNKIRDRGLEISHKRCLKGLQLLTSYKKTKKQKNEEFLEKK